MDKARTYIAIDLKSFYASVECVERGLDALTTNLVVADESRTDKTICLAVSPSLKAYGIGGRGRLFEVKQRVKEVNAERARKARLTGKSSDDTAVQADPHLALDFIIAVPRMGKYMEVSSKIYEVYLKYVSSEDIHVYSIDEVFIDATDYLPLYGLTAHELTRRMIRDVLDTTHITATAGIAPNLYLAKIAMDIEAKHSPADKDGVRIAELDERTYREKYWTHRPLTDFWRLGRGIANRLEKLNLYTLGDVARCSINREEVLYREFGVNAELIIDHAWGWEPCTLAQIKAYRPTGHSLSSGQVLSTPYTFQKARIIVREMTDLLVLDLVEKRLVADQMVLNIGYDKESLDTVKDYKGPVAVDHYGRKVPKPVHGSVNLGRQTSSSTLIADAVMDLYDRITDPRLLIRRLNVTANHVVPESQMEGVQLNLFEDAPEDPSRERSRQEAILAIRRRFGPNAILTGIDFEEGATTRERNNQIGGHRK